MTDSMLVYTAQSKQYFYCRDAVCEYVFKNGSIPINPFRAFDYFLGDRVDRSLVREGNRKLLSVSDEVWVFGEELADGVLIEIAQAFQQGKPVRYFSIDNDADAITPLEPTVLNFEIDIPRRSGLDHHTLLRHVTSGTAWQVVDALGRAHEVRGRI